MNCDLPLIGSNSRLLKTSEEDERRTKLNPLNLNSFVIEEKIKQIVTSRQVTKPLKDKYNYQGSQLGRKLKVIPNPAVKVQTT